MSAPLTCPSCGHEFGRPSPPLGARQSGRVVALFRVVAAWPELRSDTPTAIAPDEATALLLIGQSRGWVWEWTSVLTPW